jgi:predicted dehydrogenase
MSHISYGVVGTGYFGMALARALGALPRASIVAVHDPEHGDRAAAALGAEAEATVEDLVARDDVDAVIVASPNWAHADAVVAAARAGKDVFCEKPIALSYRDCARMVAATKASGTLFMAGHIMNFMSGVRRAKALISEGAIGDVLVCRAIRTGWEDAQPSVMWKKVRALSGGHLYHHIHELDLVQFIMGPATVATMVGGNVAHRGSGNGDEDDLLLITLEFEGDRFATLEYGSAFRWPEHYVLIQGTRGAIRIDLQDVGVTLRRPEAIEQFLLHRTEEEDVDRSRIYRDATTDGAIMYGNPDLVPPLWLRGVIDEEVRYFHGLMLGDSLVDEFAALTDGSAAMASIATADALTLSLAEGRKVAVAEIVAGSIEDRVHA